MPPPGAPRAKALGATSAAAPPKSSKLIKGKATASSTSSGGQQPLVLHVAKAAKDVAAKPTGLLGRITEFKRQGRDLGHLLPYAQKWNAADISPATRGLGKDRLPAPDPAGDRSSEEHFMRLRNAVKELDSAWYDATNNLMVRFSNFSQPLPVSLFPAWSYLFFGFMPVSLLSILPVPEFCGESAALSTKLNLKIQHETGTASPRVSG
jgi:hypothetical protein